MPGTVLLCDYAGFKVPEMIKKRPAIIVSPRLRHRDYLCTVVPLSSEPPVHEQVYHHIIEFDPPLPKPWSDGRHWVKADMVATVGFHRLHLIGIGRDQQGKRKYLNIQIGDDDLKAIQSCVLHALGLSDLVPHL